MPLSTDKRKEGAEQLQKIATRMAMENPCATRAEIAEMVKQEVSERAEKQFTTEYSNGR
mgnify:CR=1 FL=1